MDAWCEWVCTGCAQVSDRDDRLLTEQLLDLEKANQEVAGDADSEEEVGMGELDVDEPAVPTAAEEEEE